MRGREGRADGAGGGRRRGRPVRLRPGPAEPRRIRRLGPARRDAGARPAPGLGQAAHGLPEPPGPGPEYTAPGAVGAGYGRLSRRPGPGCGAEPRRGAGPGDAAGCGARRTGVPGRGPGRVGGRGRAGCRSGRGRLRAPRGARVRHRTAVLRPHHPRGDRGAARPQGGRARRGHRRLPGGGTGRRRAGHRAAQGRIRARAGAEAAGVEPPAGVLVSVRRPGDRYGRAVARGHPAPAGRPSARRAARAGARARVGARARAAARA